MNDSFGWPVNASSTNALRRELGRWDLALLFVVAVLNLNTVSSIATSGPVALWLWLAALLCFFLPQSIAVIELSHRYPGEGGLYLWSKEVFGDFHGFIAGWAYLTTNVFYIPFVLLYLLGIGLYVGGPRARMLIDNPFVAFPAVLFALFLITAVNVVGVGVAKWVNNLGGIGTLLASAVLIGMSASTFRTHGASLHPSDLIHLHLDWTTVSAFGAMCFSLIGLELASVMGDEIHNPERTLPRAIALSGIACGLLYIATTAALLMAIPAAQIGVVQGFIEAISQMSRQVGLPWILPALAIILSTSIIGIASAWLTGCARLPFVFGLDRYLPPALGKIHPRYKTPHVALIAQSTVCALFLAMSFAGAAVKEAFVTMLDLSAVLNLVPYVYIFAAILMLTSDKKAPFRPPGRFSNFTLRTIGSVGLFTTLLAIAVVFAPSKQVRSVPLFELKMFSGSLFFLALGSFFFFTGRRKLRAAPQIT
ncbi:MAG TPA: APC family permease [Terriglobales bacterium]|nr:APC family permease [Terriglobales bacterium]